MSRFATSAREKNHNALNIDRTYSWIKTGFPAMHRNATSSRLALGRALAWQAVSMLRAPRGLVRCWSIPLIGREIKQLWVGSVETLVDSNWLARAQHSGVFSNPGALRASTPRKFALFFFLPCGQKWANGHFGSLVHFWQRNDTAKASQLARNHSIGSIRHRSHITTTKQLGESWLELAGVLNKKKLGSSRKFELDQIQANSSHLKPSDTQLHRSRELGSSWLELARALASRLSDTFVNAGDVKYVFFFCGVARVYSCFHPGVSVSGCSREKSMVRLNNRLLVSRKKSEQSCQKTQAALASQTRLDRGDQSWLLGT